MKIRRIISLILIMSLVSIMIPFPSATALGTVYEAIKDESEKEGIYETFALLYDLEKASLIARYELMLSIAPSGFSKKEIQSEIEKIKRLPCFE